VLSKGEAVVTEVLLRPRMHGDQLGRKPEVREALLRHLCELACSPRPYHRALVNSKKGAGQTSLVQVFSEAPEPLRVLENRGWALQAVLRPEKGTESMGLHDPGCAEGSPLDLLRSTSANSVEGL
jgi:hypothetical protein